MLKREVKIKVHDDALGAIMDAIEILQATEMQLTSGPLAIWRIVDHAVLHLNSALDRLLHESDQ